MDEETQEPQDDETTLEDGEIIGRINLANIWLKDFRSNDLASSNQYIDANGSTFTGNEGWDTVLGNTFRSVADVPDVIPIGQPNYMAINTEVSAAAVSSQCPKLHIRANEDPKEGFPGAGAIVQQAWNQAWHNGAFKRVMRDAYRKRKICGLGCVWFRWDINYGFCIENVTSNRFFFDPHTTNMRRPRYAGVAINMPLTVAVQRYDPKGDKGWFTIENYDPGSAPPEYAEEAAIRNAKNALNYSDDTAGASGERTTCRIYIYFDMEEEVHVYENKVLYRTKNLYGKIPLFFSDLFGDPRDRILPLGMNVYARGLNQQVVQLAAIAANTAKNGAVITLYDSNIIKGPEKDALENGSAQQMIGVQKINPQAPPIHRIAAEELSPAYGIALGEAKSSMDGIMGASPAARGESTPGVTATQAMLSESKSNAMQVDEQVEFEDWCTDVARAFVMCTQKFGGPEENKKTPNEAKLLWNAFMAVHDVVVVHGSTAFSNPATEMTATMQLFTTILTSMPEWNRQAALGLVTKVPNLHTVFNDMLIAANRTNIDEYWEPAPPPPSGPQALAPDLVKAFSVIYPLAPPDIQRQMELQLGFQPSQVGTPAEPDKGAQSLQIVQIEQQMEAMKINAKLAEAHLKIQADAQQNQSDHVHEASMKVVDTASQIAVNNAKAAVEPKPTPTKPATKKKAT